MSRPASLTTRLTLLFVLVSSSVLLGLGWVLHAAVERHFVEMDRDLLQSKLDALERLLKDPSAPAGLVGLQSAVDEMFRSDPELKVWVQISGDGVLSPPDLSLPSGILRQHADSPEPHIFSWWHEDVRYRGLAQSLQPTKPDVGPQVVVVAINIDHHERFMARYNQTLTVFIAVAALLSGFLGWWASRRGIAPLRLIQERAAEVTARHLHHRFPETSVPRELTGLAHELNCMFARLEEAFDRLAAFSSDLAHELRTPVNNVLTQTQVAISRDRDAESYREVLISNVEELDRLSSMISDMLLLAKADDGLNLPSVEPVRLEQEIGALFEFYDALAEEERVRLRVTGQGEISGNRLMLRRAFSNLISNALRHSFPDHDVILRIRERTDWIDVTVENTGEPLQPQESSRLFDRFYRGDPARGRQGSGGVGLGLAITQALIQAHQGRIRVEPAGELTRFIVSLPKRPDGLPPSDRLAQDAS
ncbi:MAG TPA: heavy metal sensor histidine kinase [Guyparkeria sp.]|nr:heavy metal sensor histidine kinase [Guyparkeria sp.]